MVCESSNTSEASRPARPSWPDPFPGYVGRFVYNVDETNHPQPVKSGGQEGLGNGVYLWQLHILPGTVTFSNRGTKIQCHMKKELVELPEDASMPMKEQIGKFVVEQWDGDADPTYMLLSLSCPGTSPAPVEATLQFKRPDVPLSREVLAGKYQMQLVEDGMVIKAVHASWVEFAKLSPRDAVGFMLRVNEGTSICPMIQPNFYEETIAILRKAQDFLHDATFYEGGTREVFYRVRRASLMQISTKEERFQAEVSIELRYLVSAEDVFEYAINPYGWNVNWRPNKLQVLNMAENDSVESRELRPTFSKRDDGTRVSACASVITVYRGVFTEPLELYKFPFDTQWFHVKLSESQQSDVIFRKDTTDTNWEGVDHSILKRDWLLKEWVFRQADIKHDEVDDGADDDEHVTMGIVFGIKARRRYFSYLLRVCFVMLLTVIVTLSVFAMDALGDLGGRLELVFTMMLTAASYSTVVAGLLPELGYLTLLDYYVLMAFVFYVLAVCQVSLVGIVARGASVNWEQDQLRDLPFASEVEYFCSGWNAQDLDHNSFLVDVTLIVLGHLAFAGYVVCYVGPMEDQKQLDSLSCVTDVSDSDGYEGSGGSSDDEPNSNSLRTSLRSAREPLMTTSARYKPMNQVVT